MRRKIESNSTSICTKIEEEENSPFWWELDALVLVVLRSDGDDVALGAFLDGHDAIAKGSQLVDGGLHSSCR